mgnify:CR=1 FL=1
MKTKLVAVIALIFCAFMAEASKVEGNGNIITKEISVDNYSDRTGWKYRIFRQ